MGRIPIELEVFKRTHVKKKENESDSDVWVAERAERTFQIKEQVLNLARRPTTSSPAEDTDDDSDEDDDFVDCTPQLRWAAKCPETDSFFCQKNCRKSDGQDGFVRRYSGLFYFFKPRKAMDIVLYSVAFLDFSKN
ncbi:hypothetical protein H5410_041209 [Solanum commersonii]|uniref:Uncharacterized protein n=1 Tax=Solanum commersonii TaxID=4109 RepID=A0A9J5XT05_SOLCO|nr:hypothetical protein H5410_041209 [Solanum commersonii]